MAKTRYQLGLEKLSEVAGKAGENVIQSLETVAPDLGRFIIEFAFGDIYTRPQLDLKQREFITLASLAAIGDTPNQLKVHIQGALNVGISQAAIVETFIHCVPYIGFPRVLNAVSVAKSVFTEAK